MAAMPVKSVPVHSACMNRKVATLHYTTKLDRLIRSKTVTGAWKNAR